MKARNRINAFTA